jgi:urease accessory protein
MTGVECVPDVSPHLDLSFRRHPVHGTWLDRRLYRWPYTLSRGFRLDGDALTVVLQTVSGAIQADDRLVQRIHAGPAAAVHIAAQGAMAVHRARGGTPARDEIMLDIEDHGRIEYWPELRILFPDAALSQLVRISLTESATAIIADGFVMHDPEGTHRPFGKYDSELLLQRPDGRLLALDRMALTAPPRTRGKRAGFVAFGTLVVAVVRPPSWVDALCMDVHQRLAQLPGLYAAASALPNGAGATMRIAASNGRHLRLGLQLGWSAVRQHLNGRA